MIEYSRKMNRSSTIKTHTMDTITKDIEGLLKSGDVMERIYQSLEGLCRVGVAILESDSIKGDWVNQIKDEEGNPLSPAQKQKFKHALGPLVDSIRKGVQPSQTGGAETDLDTDRENVAKMMNVSPNKLNELREGDESIQPYDPEKASGVDEFYTSFMKKLESINDTMNQFASKYGISRIEQEYDLDKDFRVIPTPIASLISAGVGKINPLWYEDSKEVMDKIRIPFRLIVTAIYLFLDMTRIAVTLQGDETQRKTLTIALVLIEFLRGDWKKAILSFAGYYGTTPMLMGQFGKIYLSMLRLLSPTLQNQISYGVLDVSKSFIIGILLAIFKVAAPQETRLAVIGIFSKIAEKKAAIDGVLEGEGLMPRPAYLSPSFEDLNNVQALMDDPEFICSCEYKDLLKQADQSAIIHIVLQMMRIPVTKEYREKYTCPEKECKPFVKALVDASTPPSMKEEQKEATTETGPTEASPTTETGPTTETAPTTEEEKKEQIAPPPPYTNEPTAISAVAENKTAASPPPFENKTAPQSGGRKRRTLRRRPLT